MASAGAGGTGGVVGALAPAGVQLRAPREDPRRPPALLLAVAEAGEEGLVGQLRRRPRLPGLLPRRLLVRRHGDDGRRGHENGDQEKQTEAMRGLQCVLALGLAPFRVVRFNSGGRRKAEFDGFAKVH